MSGDGEQQEQAQDLQSAQDDMAKVRSMIDSMALLMLTIIGRPFKS